jgi:hypothetical protein
MTQVKLNKTTVTKDLARLTKYSTKKDTYEGLTDTEKKEVAKYVLMSQTLLDKKFIDDKQLQALIKTAGFLGLKFNQAEKEVATDKEEKTIKEVENEKLAKTKAKLSTEEGTQAMKDIIEDNKPETIEVVADKKEEKKDTNKKKIVKKNKATEDTTKKEAEHNKEYPLVFKSPKGQIIRGKVVYTSEATDTVVIVDETETLVYIASLEFYNTGIIATYEAVSTREVYYKIESK